MGLERDGARLREPAREALRLAVAAGARETEARALLLVAAIALWHERLPGAAEPLYVQAAALFAELGNAPGVLQTWHGRMACLQAMGRHDAAIRVALANEPRAEAMGHVEAQILFWNLLALSYEKTRRHAATRSMPAGARRVSRSASTRSTTSPTRSGTSATISRVCVVRTRQRC